MSEHDPAKPPSSADTRRVIDAPGVTVHDRFDGLQFAGVSRWRVATHAHKPHRRATRTAPPSVTPSRVTPTITALPDARPSAEQFAFLHCVFRLAQIPLRLYRMQPLLRRLPACLRAIRCDDCVQAERIVQHDPIALARAVDSLVIGVTGFFRDDAVFAHLRDVVLPELARRHRPLCVWSAACSDGAELYSVGMLLAANGTPAHRLLGTDCRPSAIAAAREGRYPVTRLDCIPESLRQQFIDSIDSTDATPTHARITAGLRRLARFETGDLLDPASPPAAEWDLVLCRNMAIYVSDAAVQRLWTTLAAAVRPQGYLVVGKAERVSVPGLRRVGPSIYQKM